MKNKKICVVTGSRAEYGLLYWLIKKIEEDKSLKLQLLVTGSHLSKIHGYTFKEIISDGFKIKKKIYLPLNDDTPKGIIKVTSKALTIFSDVFAKLSPDIIVVLGDRYEIFAASISACFLNIPIAHFHGGESTEGLIDEAIRHSISKMSHLHFVSTQEYKRRVIQLGENPKKVFMVGAMGIDNIKKLKLLNKAQLKNKLNIEFKKNNILVTYHPVTLEKKTSRKHFLNILSALDNFPKINIIFTKPNADFDSKIISRLIDAYVKKNYFRAKSFYSLGYLNYLSILQFVDCVMGNSSSGIIEAPSFKIATINIGNRQKGRIVGNTVINSRTEKKYLISSIKKIYSKNFLKKLLNSKNPYGNGGAASKSIKILKRTNFKNLIMKKFYKLI